jgi:hypothetical protein
VYPKINSFRPRFSSALTRGLLAQEKLLDLGRRRVKVIRDSDLASPTAELPFFQRRLPGDEHRHRFAGFANNDRFASGCLLEQTRELRFSVLNVYGLHRT